jgi:hypothetical protein
MKREKAESMVMELANAVILVERERGGPGTVARMNLAMEKIIMALERCPENVKPAEPKKDMELHEVVALMEAKVKE